MKILIISDAWRPQINGVVRTYEHLIEHLEPRGHEIRVIGPNDFPRRIPMPGYAEIELALFPYRRLKKMIEDFKPDHIHISTEGPLGWAARKYCVRTHHKASTSYHTQFPDYTAKRIATIAPFLYGFTRNLGIKYVKTFHAPSHCIMVATPSLESELKEWGFQNEMARLTRGADLARFHIGEKTLFNNYKRPVALYVGRIAIEKNIEEFLKMKWEGTKILVGDGPARADLCIRYPETVFLGTKTGKELADCYRSADLFVFPSRTDTFGMVLVEALACGLPIAAYNATGPKDIVTEDFLGALDEESLSKAAEQALRGGNAQKSIEHIKEHYTWEKAAVQFEEAVTKYCLP